MGDNLKKNTINAVKWTTIDRFGQQGLQFIITIFLARILDRSDIGLIGSIAIFSTLSFVLVESGFTQALIRKQDANEEDYSTVFFFNLLIAISLYVVLFFTIPYIAAYFRQAELIKLGRVLFLVIILSSLYLVPLAKLTKAMKFKSIAIINITAVFVSMVLSIVSAYKGLAVWSLVIQQLSFHLTRLAGYQLSLRWFPKIIFRFKSILGFWGFSFNLLLTSILNVFFNNIFIFILGKKYSMNEVGDYTQANRLNETTNYAFQSILTSATYPIFVQIQQDDERFRRVYRSLSQKISVFVFPVLFTLIAIAKPLITVLLSSKWIPAIPYYQLLCASSLFTTLYALTISALNARGKSKETFRIEIIKKAIIVVFLVSLYKFGVMTMLWGYALANFASYFISLLFLKKDINHYIKHQIEDFLAPVGIGILIATVSYGLSFLIGNMYLLLLLQLIAAGGIFILWIKKYHTEMYEKGLNVIKSNVFDRLRRR